MTEPKLKPCPWCGGKVKVTNLDGNIHYGRRHWCVVCWDCEMFFGYDLTYGGIYKTKQGCADDWNTRVVQNELPIQNAKKSFVEMQKNQS